MMDDDLRAPFYGSCLLGAFIVASFVLWFQLRDRPAWDKFLFGLASLLMAILIGARYYLGDFAGALVSIPLIPSLVIYLWFGALWGTRRERSAIHQWGLRHGYHITSLERTYDLGSGGRRLVAEYRLVARRVSDGKILIGRVLTGSSGQGFEVLWQGEAPAQHLRRPPGDSPPSIQG